MVFLVLALGCGGRAEDQGRAGTAGAPSTGGAGYSAGGSSIGVAGSSAGGSTPGVGPIDATGLPTELPMDCAGATAPPRLALPCKIGGSLTGAEGPGSYNVVECYDLSGKTAYSSVIPFGSLPMRLNQPVQIPFASLPPPPGSQDVILSGTAVFSQVDPVGRAFVARLIGGTITWAAPGNATITCTIPDTPFWAVQGGFL